MTSRGRFRGLFALALICLLSALVSASPVQATEGGGGMYPGGNEDFMAGALPPPGFYYLHYLLYYHATSYEDIRLPNGMRARDVGFHPDFDLHVIANVARFLYVTPIKILGADWAMHLILPVVDLSVDSNNLGVHGHRAGVGDLTIDPIALGWHSKNWHLVTAVDVNVPIGTYNVNKVANTGRNYWNVEPLAAVTYLSDSKFEVSFKFMYDFNFENGDTNYTSGQEFHFDYLIGQHFGNWAFGLNGSYYIQTTDDSFSGQPAGFDGNRGQAIGLGPAALYQYNNMFFELKYQFETLVSNRPEGDKFWFRFTYAF